MLKVYNVAKVLLRLLHGRNFGSLCLYLALKKNLLQIFCGSVQSSRVKLAWIFCYCGFFLIYGLSEHRYDKEVLLGFYSSSQRDYIKPMLSVLGFPSGKIWYLSISVCHSITWYFYYYAVIVFIQKLFYKCFIIHFSFKSQNTFIWFPK